MHIKSLNYMLSNYFQGGNSQPGDNPQFWVVILSVNSYSKLFNSKVNKISIKAKRLFSKFQSIFKWTRFVRKCAKGES